MIKHFVSETTVGELCTCGLDARHKIEEHIPLDEPGYSFWSHRHPFTAYVCCGCFGRIMGIAAIKWCGALTLLLNGDGEIGDLPLFVESA